MRLVALAAIAFAVASAAVAAPLPAPLAPASDGKLQCYAPSQSTKSCQALTRYEIASDGAIDNTAVVLIAATPPTTMQTVGPVTINSGQVCGVIRPEDIAAAQFSVDDAPATPSQAAALRRQIARSMKALFGHEICTAYVTEGDHLIAKASVDGTPRPELDQKVVWVSPADGFKVQP